MTRTVILASASPRRTALLNQLGIAHSVAPVDIDESRLADETPLAQVARLAREKAQASAAKVGLTASTVILASDTLISFNGESVGKPIDRNDAHRILSMLSGNTHEVHTSICVMSTQGQKTQVITTQVEFASLTPAQIDAYWDTGEPTDKAGSYAIQGIGGQFVVAIKGSASAVVGLPLFETRELLNEFGVTS